MKPLSEVSADGDTLIFQRDLRHSPEKVWRALTDPAQLSRWSPFITGHDFSTIGPGLVTMVDGEVREETEIEVRLADPPRLLEYTWGNDLLVWELTPIASGTRLVLRHTVQGREWLSKVAAGWHLCLVVTEHLLDGDPIEPIRGRDAMNHGWAELNEAYLAQLVVH